MEEGEQEEKDNREERERKYVKQERGTNKQTTNTGKIPTCLDHFFGS